VTMLLTAQLADRDFPQKPEDILENGISVRAIRPESSGKPRRFGKPA
jgi:hypothetical protein